MAKQTLIPDLIEKFWETITPAWHATRAHIRKVASENFHLTVEQFQVLRRIHRGVESVSALAEANRTSRSSVSKAVDALVNKGLVSRNTDAHDRRHVHLSLTGEGERVLSAIYAETEAWLAARFARLTPEELAETLHSLDLLRKAFAED
ncbi:MAG: MarR family transcriptional regulator [Anaerolineales bacterium]|nr:MarR family transcriptional regulator [Anaerolineales bacterium]